jgi:hypothetical protein
MIKIPITCLLIVLISQFCGAKKVDDFFSIKGVETSYDAGNLEDSKIFAFDNAALSGFRSMAFKMIPYTQKDKIYKIRNSEIINSVKKVTPHKERMTHHSYMAKVDVYFDQQKVTNILNKYGIRYRTEYSENILFVPLFYEKDDDYDVSLKKIWRHTWLNLEDTFGLLKISTYDDALSTSLDHPLKAIFQPYSTFHRILEDNHAKNAVIVFAELNNQSLEFTLRFLTPETDKLKYFISKKSYKETKDSFFARAINELLEKIDSEWKGIKSFNQTIVFTSKVKIKTEIPKIWSAIQNEFKNLPQIKNYKILKTTIDYMEVEIDYTIPSQSFRELLIEKGIFMDKKDGLWYLSLTKRNVR